MLRPQLADWMTIAHGLCGYVALALLARHWLHGTSVGVRFSDLRLAGTLVTAGAVLDTLDGPVSRRFGSSELGDLLDGMCDTVTFGVVPAVLVAATGAARGGAGGWAQMGVGGVYLAAMILRLARTQLIKADQQANDFRGLPAPPASAATVSAVVLNASPAITCLLFLGAALLMVSNCHYPRNRPAVMPVVASGPVVWLLGAWGVLPLRPAMIVTMILTVVLPASSAVSRRQARWALSHHR